MQCQRKIWLIGVFVWLVWCGSVDYALSAVRAPDIHYVPTPQYVVNEMLELAGTNKNDIVYDLGCGDGRFVITAAKNYGARGIGIDIDLERIRESKANALKAGVADRVTFLEQDLFTTDFSQATIVALYLLPSLNLKLRPKLFAQLKPGTRILSHDFEMDDWKPDFTGRLGESTYYYWVIPADVKGTWQVRVPALGKDGEYMVDIDQNFQNIGLTLLPKRPEATISPEPRVSHFKIKGDKISFFITRGLGRARTGMYFKGQVTGDSISGTVEVETNPFYQHLAKDEDASINGNHPWTAVRGK